MKKHGLKAKKGASRDALIEALSTIGADAGREGEKHGMPEPGHEPSHLPQEEPGFQQVVEESKYYTGQPLEQIYGLASELPSYYNDDSITLLVRDPHWAFAYWDISQNKIDDLRRSLGDAGRDAHLAIRLYDITGVEFTGFNAHSHFDIGIFDRVGNWYINTGSPGAEFIADLGLKSATGGFVTLARSNPISTPRDTVSDVLDAEWLVPEEIFQRIFALSGGTAGGPLSAGALSSAGMPEARRAPSEMLEQLGGISSPGMGSLALMSPVKPQQERGFWFMLNAELIIYGATEPGAKVELAGVPVQLRPDGTFSLRFALPDGAHAFPFAAASADGVDSMGITTRVSRETEAK